MAMIPASEPVPAERARNAPSAIGSLPRPRCGGGARPRKPLAAALLALLLGLLLGLALAGCGRPAPRSDLDYTRDEQFAIEDPGGRHATATGIGCALSRQDALTRAEDTARYNLRGVMGAGRYRIRVDRLREYREAERYCAEVIARAMF